MIKNILKRNFSKTLYLWGDVSSSLNKFVKKNPSKVEGFDNLIEKAAIGSNHGAFITKNNELYTFGKNNYGQCGFNPSELSKLNKPHKIDFFEKKNINLKDVKIGKFHTMVLDENGKVYTFGQGIRKIFFLIDYLFPSVCALGRNKVDKINSIPRMVKLENKIDNIETGFNHCLVLDENKDVYVWGRGEFGVLGLGTNKILKTPLINTLLQQLAEAYETKIKKIRSIGSFSSILMENGKIFSFGINDFHQMGNDIYLGLDIFESVNIPTEIKQKYFNDEKIIDFEIGEKLSLFKTEKNKFYFSGRKISLTPEIINFDRQDEVKLFSCSNDGYALVLNNNEIHFTGNFFNHNIGIEDLDSGVYKLENPFTDGNIIELGGGLNHSFALVEE